MRRAIVSALSQLGIPGMDGEHGRQVRLLRALQESFLFSDQERALELVDQLDDYTNMHFLLEETLMIRRAYPGYQAHRQEHDHLIEELRRLRSAITSGGQAEGSTEADAIEQWLFRHIETFDRALATYLAHPSGQSEARFRDGAARLSRSSRRS